ncbi:MAG: hypothetical protein ACT4O0_14870 [Pseudonocardia sp.]|jgi:hypothetical protein
MAVKVVKGTDGRTWTVRRQMQLRMPAIGQDFEHDVDGGTVGKWVILGLLALFYLALFTWSGLTINVPGWAFFFVLIVVGFLVTRVISRRPWKITAQTPGAHDPEHPDRRNAAHWVATVRGVSKSQEEITKGIRRIRMKGEPNDAKGLWKESN